MSKLNVDQKTIKDLLSDNKADFLIPDYQRPYAWDAEKECFTLWEDVFAFAIPEGNALRFDRSTAEYYLGPIVTFKNNKGQKEIIDGQQRLTTIMLLLREMIGKCIWKTDEFDQPDMNCLKINSEVATDNDREEFLAILKDGIVNEKMKSRYAENFRFFQGKKDEFIKRWRKLEEICEKHLHSNSGTPMDELFSRYMYYERAKKGIKLSTTEALRSFYGANNYALLKSDETLCNMELLADFWNDVYSMSDERFSPRVLRQLFVLNYAPNSMWTFFVSVYFLSNKDANNQLDDEKFYKFLTKSIAFIWAYAITNPGVNALRTPVYAEMVNIINGKEVDFSEFRFPQQQTANQFDNYNFYNGRPITKSMLVWWCMQDNKQELPSLDTVFEIEHIYARNRYDREKSLSSKEVVEKLGNKSILEKRINIRASDFRFGDKKKYYNGYTTSKGDEKKATCVEELKQFAKTKTDFAETDIKERTITILEAFGRFLDEQGLIK